MVTPRQSPAKCGLCGTSFLPCEIPVTALVGDGEFHMLCYREHYEAREYEPEELIQSRHREFK